MIYPVFKFDFGFIIPGSKNDLDSTIHGAGKGKMLSPEMLKYVFSHFLIFSPYFIHFFLDFFNFSFYSSGKLMCIIRFYEGEKLLAEKQVLVYYV